MAGKTGNSVQPPPRRPTVANPENATLTLTDIDRRKCTRVVPLKVICLGLSRTGTSSLRQALLDLGYNDCYHFASVFNENPRDADMWNEAYEAKFEGKGKPFEKEDWDQLLGHCMAITDTPCTDFYRELLAAYPEAKVVLTVRDSPQQWHSSVVSALMEPWFDLLDKSAATWRGRALHFLMPMHTGLAKLSQKLHRHTKFRTMREEGVQFYEDHNAAVMRCVPRDNLLVFNVKEGWEPLCEFLGKDVPAWALPRCNEREPFRNTCFGYNDYLEAAAETRLRRITIAAAGVVLVTALGVSMRFNGGFQRNVRAMMEWITATLSR